MMPAEVNGARLLIVDDEEQIRRSLSRLLERSGHNCTTAAGAVGSASSFVGRERSCFPVDQRAGDPCRGSQSPDSGFAASSNSRCRTDRSFVAICPSVRPVIQSAKSASISPGSSNCFP